MSDDDLDTLVDYYQKAAKRRFWFEPISPDVDPPQLVCGRHTKAGRFIPKNIALTSIARLGKYPYDGVHRPFPMIGDGEAAGHMGITTRGVYEMHLKHKQAQI